MDDELCALKMTGRELTMFPLCSDAVRILVLDDVPDVRRAIVRLLGRLKDVEVTEAGDLAGALALVRAEPFDLVLVDIRLSDDEDAREGLEFLREARKHDRGLACVIVTSSSAMDDLREA